jgi:hypothetical protein
VTVPAKLHGHSDRTLTLSAPVRLRLTLSIYPWVRPWETSIDVSLGLTDICDVPDIAPYCNPINHEFPLSETYYLSWTTEATATANVRATYNSEQRRWEYTIGSDHQVTYNLPPLPPPRTKKNGSNVN